MNMITYREFSPTQLDTSGLGCDDQQDWLVAPVTVNRDSGCLMRSNWAVVTAELLACSEHTSVDDERDVEIHRFGHWGPGWFELCLVRPGSKSAEVAQEWENALDGYPVACEEHLSGLEHEEVVSIWENMTLRERVLECQSVGESVFAARHGSPPERVYDRIRESL